MERKNPQNVTYYQYDKQGNTVSELTKRFLKPETTKSQNGNIIAISNGFAKTELEQYKTYEYNVFNQTSKVIVEDYQDNSKEPHVQENFYDAENLRYGIEENKVRINFVTNGWSVFTELDAEWKPTKRLVRGYGIVASEDVIVIDKTNANNYQFYHQNEHGDVEYITGSTGKVDNAYTYDAFGNITNSTELVQNRYTYNGEQYDTITNQYYLRARYYNPLVGRFIQEDVYRRDGLNLYAYCGNNSVMYIDSSGYSKKCEIDSDRGSDPVSGRTDFYVTENGDVVPATEYRYMDSGRANDALTLGEQYTTYIGFTKYDSASQVKDAFQIADAWSDCKVRGEFDTLQVIDNMYVPTENGNTTTIPEPITCSYPEYGRGGEQQLCVDIVVKFEDVVIIGD